MRDKRLFVVERGDLKTKLCESCGKLIKIKSKTKPEKYCEKCAYTIKLEQVNECKKRKKEGME